MFRQIHLIMRMVASLCLLAGMGVSGAGLWRIDSANAALDAVHSVHSSVDVAAQKPDAPKPVSNALFYAKMSDCRWSLAAPRRADNEPSFSFSNCLSVVDMWPAGLHEKPVARVFAFVPSIAVTGFVSRAPPRPVSL